MSEWSDFLQKTCPNGVEYRKLEDCCEILDSQRKNIAKDDRETGPYPYYSANGIQDYVSDYIFDGDFVLVGEDGSVTTKEGTPVVTWATGKIWVSTHAHILSGKEGFSLRYLFHCLQTINIKSLIHVNSRKFKVSDLKALKIPAPPLEVQEEIADMLDKFTGLIELLNKELVLRLQQYAYYRDQVLTFGTHSVFPELSLNDVHYKTVESVSTVLLPDNKIKTADYLQSGKYPIVDHGKKLIAGYTNEGGAFPKGEYVVFGDRTCNLKYIDFEFVQGSDSVKVIQAGADVLTKYLYFAMRNIDMKSGSTSRWQRMKDSVIPVPPIEIQKKVIQILNQFDSLCYDPKTGIPAEIEARQKQYAYYRDKLIADVSEKASA